MQNQYYPFINEPLAYPYDFLEPYIDEETMRLHHDKHLQAYTDHLNRLLQEHPGFQKFSLEQLIQSASRFPKQISRPIKNNAGGVYNHRFFFSVMTLPSQGMPSGILLQAVENKFGSFEGFRKLFQKAALDVFGSGYAWLVTERGRLNITTTPNQDCPLQRGQKPILAVDVWEHAYYLKNQNRRTEYLKNWFQVIDWEQVQQYYQDSLCCE